MEQNIIYAKDGEIEKSYLLVISPTSVYKLTIKKINKTENNKGDVSVSSVSVLDERYPGQLNTISGDTYLLEWDEEFYNKAKSLRKKDSKEVKTEVNTDTKDEEEKLKSKKEVKIKETKPVARTKNPKSQIIDKLLAEVPEGQKVIAEEIAQKVLEQTKEPEDHLKKVIAEVNVRNWMFSKGGKVNKFKNV